MDEKLEFTLSGRLRNIVLAPNSRNAVIPLFEAITNSLHAIEDRFGPDDMASGNITIAVERTAGRVQSYRVDDNGEGLTPRNYKSFLTSDSTTKAARGGKGVGRLTWLKVFGYVDVDSYYDESGNTNRLSFRFRVDDASPITNKAISSADAQAPIGTSVRLEDMKPAFQSRAPRNKGTVEAEVVRHFVSYLIAPNAPRFVVYDHDERTDLAEFFSDHVYQRAEDIFSIEIGGNSTKITVTHLLISKHLRDVDLGYNTVYLTAHGRTVEGYAIDGQIGLSAIRDDYVYMGVVASEHLDLYVSQERTHLSIDTDEKDQIKKRVLESIKVFLSEDIAEVRIDQREKAAKVVNLNPRFMAITGGLDFFIENKVPLSMRDEEEIHLAFEREYRRERNRYARDYLKAKSLKNEAAVNQQLEKYIGFMNDDVKFTLAEYVIRRKAILDIVTDSSGFEEPEKRRYHLEKVIHEYICPMQSTSDDLSYDDHNLWVIDDRLAFYNYFASDKQIKSIKSESQDSLEPDIALFDLGLRLRRDGSDQPVVIVEFKRPGRESFSNDSPVMQMVKYVNSLRGNGTVRSKDGRILSNMNENTSFIGYIVADLTKGMRESLLGTFVNKKTADGIGVWGFEETLRTYIEVIPYEKLFRDAKARNEVFFSKLKLQS